MFNSVALDVVVGLIFIYLLYSLFATVLSEIIATKLGLRARNLKEAVDRMLNDDPDRSRWKRFWDSVNILKNPDRGIVREFYDHPEIKYLGSSGIFRHPSSFKAISFSKTLLVVLFGDGLLTREKIDARLKEIIHQAQVQGPDKTLDAQTARYINSLWLESYGDLVKFKLQLETWFDRTMEQATEWYKRKIQIVLLILGFLIAWCFNADTFTIVSKLSHDKDAREKIVSMANAYVQNNKIQIDTTAIKNAAELRVYTQKLDSLLTIKQQIEAEMNETTTLLGVGGWPADVITVHADPRSGKPVYTPHVDPAALSATHATIREGQIEFTWGTKLGYFLRLPCIHFWGFFVTAIAISLGAPFWFDLLNRLMQLRTSRKQEPDSPHNTADSTVSPLNREG